MHQMLIVTLTPISGRDDGESTRQFHPGLAVLRHDQMTFSWLLRPDAL